MRDGPWLTLVRLASVVALAASTALLLDYMTASPAFCAAGSGCEAVRRSGYGYYLLGELAIPVPLFGLLGFSALFGASLLSKPALRRLLVAAMAGVGGLVSLVLLWLQFAKVGQMCTLCVIVDVAALVAAGGAAAFYFGRKPDTGPVGHFELRGWAWLGLSVLAVGGPLAWSSVRPAPPVPAEVLKLYAPGKINVVEFADFQCPFCRLLHGRLKAIIESYPERVHFVRLNMPLDSHEHARGAAYAAICAEQQGKGEPMADLLFETEDLTPRGGRALAAKLGLDLAAFDGCVGSPETEARVVRESSILRKAGLKGLPTTYVGTAEIVGAQPEEVFRDAFERAARGAERPSLPAPGFLAFLALVAGSLVWFGRASYTFTWEPARTKKPEQSKSPST